MGSIFEAPKVTPIDTTSIFKKSDTEKRFLESLRGNIDPSFQSSQDLYSKANTYLTQLQSPTMLTPEEESDFDRQYQLQLDALNEQFKTQSTEYGGSQMADLLSRGMWDTTTGANALASTQESFARELSSQTFDILSDKEAAKYNYDLAKREAAQAGYELTSTMGLNQMQTALQAATALQNYYQNQQQMESQAAFQNALASQSAEQAAYNQRMNLISGATGLGSALLKVSDLGSMLSGLTSATTPAMSAGAFGATGASMDLASIGAEIAAAEGAMAGGTTAAASGAGAAASGTGAATLSPIASVAAMAAPFAVFGAGALTSHLARKAGKENDARVLEWYNKLSPEQQKFVKEQGVFQAETLPGAIREAFARGLDIQGVKAEMIKRAQEEGWGRFYNNDWAGMMTGILQAVIGAASMMELNPQQNNNWLI